MQRRYFYRCRRCKQDVRWTKDWPAPKPRVKKPRKPRNGARVAPLERPDDLPRIERRRHGWWE